MLIEFTEDVSKSKWKKIVSSSEHSYFTHTPQWAKILEATYGFRTATRLYNIDDNEVLLPLMEQKTLYGLKDYYSMPFGVYGGVISSSKLSSETLHDLLKSTAKGRCLSLYLCPPPFFTPLIRESPTISLTDPEWNYTHVLLLEKGFAHIWNEKFKKKPKQQVRQAERHSVEVIDASSLEDVRKYYEVYVDSTKRWGYTQPPYPVALFENTWKFGRPHVKFRLAVIEDMVIGGRIDFCYGKNVVGWMNARLKDYGKYRPMHLLIKDAIEEACNSGYKCFDFGPSGHLSGVLKFKESFGAERVELKRYSIVSNLARIATSISREKKRFLDLMQREK
jgi:hypothetical protein